MNKVALAGRCHHQPASFRHRNMYLIRIDHLPLGKFVISKESRNPVDLDSQVVFTLCSFLFSFACEMCKDTTDVVLCSVSVKVAYYKLTKR